MTPLSIGEMTEGRTVIAAAFADDPLLAWIFPDSTLRMHATAAWLGLFVEAYADHGRMDVEMRDGMIAAVALWRIPADAPLRLSRSPALGGLLASIIGSERAAAIGEGLGVLGAAHPIHEHAYLHFLAVAPAHQKTGLGRRVIQPGLDAAAQRGLGVHLETTKLANVGFYRSLGFAVTSEFVLEPAGPKAWAMFRPSPARP